MTTDLTPEDLVIPATDKTILTFGKFRGDAIGDIPAWYLLWLHEQAWTRDDYPEIWKYLEKNRANLEKEREL